VAAAVVFESPTNVGGNEIWNQILDASRRREPSDAVL